MGLRGVLIVFFILTFVPAAFFVNLPSYLLLPSSLIAPIKSRWNKISFNTELLDQEIETLQEQVNRLKTEKVRLINHYDKEYTLKWSKIDSYLKQVIKNEKGEKFAENYLNDVHLIKPLKWIPIPSSVLGEHIAQWDRKLELDRGEKHGVRVGDPVVCGDVLVGQITAVTTWTSTMSHITNDGMKIPCTLANFENLRGLVVGVGRKVKGEFTLIHYLDRRGTFGVGHQVFTGGISDKFPEGFLMGTIKKKSKKDNEMYFHVEMEPAIPFYNISEVIILRSVKDE